MKECACIKIAACANTHGNFDMLPEHFYKFNGTVIGKCDPICLSYDAGKPVPVLLKYLRVSSAHMLQIAFTHINRCTRNNVELQCVNYELRKFTNLISLCIIHGVNSISSEKSYVKVLSGQQKGYI